MNIEERLANETGALRVACLALEKTVRILRRIRQWDMLDATADGPTWKREIDEVLSEVEEFEG